MNTDAAERVYYIAGKLPLSPSFLVPRTRFDQLAIFRHSSQANVRPVARNEWGTVARVLGYCCVVSVGFVKSATARGYVSLLLDLALTI